MNGDYTKECNQNERHSVEQIAHHRTTNSAHPKPATGCEALDAVHEPCVRQLAEKEAGERSNDDTRHIREHGVVGVGFGLQIIGRREPNTHLSAKNHDYIAHKSEPNNLSGCTIAPYFGEDIA